MKTAISLPDELFDAAEDAAERLGVSRSELYARALRRYVEELRAQDVTRRLNEVYARESSSVDPALAAMQSASIAEDEW